MKGIIMTASSAVLSGGCRETAPREEIRIPLIMYHYLDLDRTRCGDYVIDPETLEGDLVLLRERGFTSVVTEDLLDWIDGKGELPPKSVMLTFDDGPQSFAVYALPLLEKYGMKAVQAPVGAWADGYGSIHSDKTTEFMDWACIAETAASGRVEMINHSYGMHVTEPRYGLMKKEEEDGAAYRAALSDDLARAETKLAAACGYVPKVYAYPYGAYCSEAKEILAGRGYRLVFTCVEQVNVLKRGAAEPVELGRFNRAFSLEREKLFAAFEN